MAKAFQYLEADGTDTVLLFFAAHGFDDGPADRKSQDREGARAERATDAPRPCRRGDRVLSNLVPMLPAVCRLPRCGILTARDAQPSYVWGEITNARGDKRTARIKTANGYSLTVTGALAVVEHLLAHEVPGGTYTPAKLIGPDLVRTHPDCMS